MEEFLDPSTLKRIKTRVQYSIQDADIIYTKGRAEDNQWLPNL